MQEVLKRFCGGKQNLTHLKGHFWSYLNHPYEIVVVWVDRMTGNMDPWLHFKIKRHPSGFLWLSGTGMPTCLCGRQQREEKTDLGLRIGKTVVNAIWILRPKFCSIEKNKAKMTTTKKTTDQERLKRFPVVKTRGFSLAIWFVRFTSCTHVLMVERSTIILHASFPEIGWHTACHPAVHQQVYFRDTFSEFDNWVPWKREKWNYWRAV